jgi:hypothetical protein
MPTFFISHSSDDDAVAKQLGASLDGDGLTEIFLSFDPEHGIPPGHRWEEEIYSALHKADALVFLCTKAAVASGWCHTELAMARALHKTIIPLRLEENVTHPLIADTQWLSAGANGNFIALLRAALERLGLDADDRPRWNTGDTPYPGLRPFDADRAGVFYGREREIGEVRAKLEAPASGGDRLILVLGPSGSGKSSLVRGGVLPRLRPRDGWVVVEPFTPESAPREQLCRKIATALDDRDWHDVCNRIEGEGLVSVTRDLRAAARAPDGIGAVVISVDQAEQLVTQVARKERVAFLNLLATAFDQHAPLRVIATARDEYPAQILADTELEGRGATFVPIGRLSRGRLGEVIELPAKRAGVFFEGGLVARMVDEAASQTPAGGDPLPLLAFVLERLYKTRHGNQIRNDDYDALGGLTRALEDEANRVVDDLRAQGLGKEVVDALIRLTNVESRAVVGGKSASRDSFTPAEWSVIEAFRDARLVTTQGDGPTAAVAHEALLREWSVMKNAIREREDELVLGSRLERDAREWLLKKDPAELLPAAGVRAARRVLHTNGREGDPAVKQFVAASRRRVRRGRAIVALVAVVVVAVALGGWFTYSWYRERQDKASARAPLVDGIDAHEVTYRQYRLCVSHGACERPAHTGVVPDLGDASAGNPVVGATAAMADEFCDWIGRKLPTAIELQSADRSPRIRHLLDRTRFGKTGGKEWTSTKTAATSRKVVQRDPLNGGKTSLTDIDSGNPEPALGFRCASS